MKKAFLMVPGLPAAGGLRRAVRDSDANGLLAGFRSGGNQ